MSEHQEDEAERFFSTKQSERKDSVRSNSIARSIDSDEEEHKSCLTLRILQYLLPCLRNKGVWEPSQGDVFKSHDAEESKYPRILRILENKVFDAIFVSSCFMSIFLFLFSEGFLLESRLLWGIIHLVNAVYALGLFSQWLQILIKSKYAKTNHGYTTRDIVYTLVSVFPADLIVLVIYTLNDDDDNEDNEAANPIEHWMITVSRLNYFLRIRSILQYFSKWENHLVVGDFCMFMLRTCLFTFFLIHALACVWHRLACKSFRLKHFLMTPDEATTDVCEPATWIGHLKVHRPFPLLDHPEWHVLLTHYLASVYWTIIAFFRLGAGDIETTLTRNEEVAFVTFIEILAWLFVLVNINGTLASLFIEKDVEKEDFLTRCFAIELYLRFTDVARTVQDDVERFYNYLWKKGKGIINVDLVDVMPHAMKSAVFYDVNKFVMDQLPMLKGLDTPFLMSLSVHTTHKFFLSGEILFHKNDTASAMYYLVKGHLEVLSDDEKHSIATIRSGSIIGEVHLLQPYPHIATVRCGSDCDLLVLSRKHFRRVLNVYPQYISNLEQRLENRLEQSGLLLALCEKHNTYHKAFKALRESSANQVNERDFHRAELTHSFENVTKILGGGAYDTKQQRSTDDDFDGLEISGDMEAQLHLGVFSERKPPQKKGFEEILAAAYLALETDVARAGSLATDLNIPRPPLIVTAPDTSTHVTLGFRQHADTENIFVRLFKRLKEPSKGTKDFLWKLLTSTCALAVFWYYPYRFAFRNENTLPDYIFHFTDVIFAMDCIYDFIQIVVLPQKTFESFREIFLYHLKRVYFYIRVLSFLPFEYVIASTGNFNNGDVPSPYFYLLKFNRLFQIHLIIPFMSNVEAKLAFSPVVFAVAKLGLGVFFVAHIFTVGFKFVLRDVNEDNSNSYRGMLYRALVVTTSTGYGDIRSKTTLELIVEVLGLMIGVSVMICMQAKVTAILVNCERQRVSFQQTYYALKDFMKQRKFPKLLKSRVSEYYELQWESHRGTLTPGDKHTIWDAPKTLITKVSTCIAQKYIARIPLFMNAPASLQAECCLALKYYMIPPGEVLLYPEEIVRDLYIIFKGYVDVIHKNKRIGVFTEGRYFGLSGLINGANSDYMFVTRTHCQVFCLHYSSFLKVANSNAIFFQEYQQLGETHKGSEDVKQSTTESSATSTDSLVDLTYPTSEFLEKLTAAAPPYDDTAREKVKLKRNLSFLRACMKCVSCCDIRKCSDLYFLPNGKPLRCWIAFRVFTSALATVFAAAQLAFPISPFISLVVTHSFDIIAWTDMFFSMRTAYLGSQQQLITASREMVVYYLKGNFLIDILGCFPADLIAFFLLAKYDQYKNYYHVVSFLRLNRMIQCSKLFMANSILEKGMYRSLSFIMLLEMAPIMFLFISVTACFSILPVCEFTTTGQPNNCTNKDAWILDGVHNTMYSSQIQGLYDVFGAYIVGLYWVIQTIFCVGFGDVEIVNDPTNQIIAILVICIGIMTATYVGAKLTSCIVGEDPAKIALQEKMVLMDEYLEQHRVTKNSRRRVQEMYLNAWNKTQGVSPADLFEALPPTLKMDVMKQLYGSALQASPLFEHLESPGLRMLASSLREAYYSEGELLMKFGDLCDDIFFIAHGAVVCYNVRGDIMSQLGRGSLIGEVGPFFHTHRLYSAIALKDVSAFVFSREAFTSFLDQYPDIRSVVETCSWKHYKEAMTGSKRAGSLDFGVSLNYHHEKGGEDVLGLLDKQFQSQEKSESVISPASHYSNEDMTRRALKEDLMKTPEEFSKTANENWWSVFVTFGRMSKDEMGLVHIYQDLENFSFLRFTIHPASTVCGWVSFCLVLTALSCSITSYEVAFASRHRATETVPLTVTRYLLEIFYFIRIFGNFHLAYYDDTDTMITNVRAISRRYAQKIDGLWLDVITTFPFYLVEYFVPTLKGEYIRAVQLLRVCLFVRYLKETDSRLKLKASRFEILKITILLCFIFHFWACAWYLIACTDECTTGSWMQEVLNAFRGHAVIAVFVCGFVLLFFPLTGSGGTHIDDKVSTMSRYLLSVYYVTNTLTYTGFAEITARTKIELCLTVAMLFGTAFIIGYLVGEMVQCLASQVATKIHYQHKLSVLENHFETLGISYAKIDEVRHYFKLLWCRCRGMVFYTLMEELPYTIRADIAMEIYGPNMNSSRILGKLDENLIRQLCARIRHEIYFPGSHIVRAGDVCTSMYFIKKGEVVILDGNSNLELCVEILYENECFGEVKILLAREQYRFSYVARLESEVGVLHREDLEAVLKNHPRIFEELKEKASRVKVRRLSVKEEEDREKSGVHGAVSSMSIKSLISQVSAAAKSAAK